MLGAGPDATSGCHKHPPRSENRHAVNVVHNLHGDPRHDQHPDPLRHLLLLNRPLEILLPSVLHGPDVPPRHPRRHLRNPLRHLVLPKIR